MKIIVLLCAKDCIQYRDSEPKKKKEENHK